jgi:four helix bundle suffix protein
MSEPLIPEHGGYRKLRSFQVAQLVYDVTVRFCSRYVPRTSRTRDQMVQAARSGVQNIAEGSMASGTSKKTELKLTNVARASLEELCLDFEDYLRQHGLELWPPDHPALRRFKAKRIATMDEFVRWVAEELELAQAGAEGHGPARTNTDEHGQGEDPAQSVSVSAGQWRSVYTSELVANGALSLLNVCCYLLDRQLAAQAAAFEREGGFTERLFRVRSERRKGQ